MRAKAITLSTSSVAMQQKVSLAVLTNRELHREMLVARNTLYEKCVDAHTYIADVLLPRCEAIIARYKMQGVAAKDRPNSKPTVEAYFKSIGLNYNTVRSWIHRKRLETEMFRPKTSTVKTRANPNVPHLTLLEARLLGTASAGHELVKAIKQGGNLDEAVHEFLEHAPTPARIEEFIERPVHNVSSEIKNLVIRLCKLVERNSDKQEQEIVALARELLNKVEPTTKQVLGVPISADTGGFIEDNRAAGG